MSTAFGEPRDVGGQIKIEPRSVARRRETLQKHAHAAPRARKLVAVKSVDFDDGALEPGLRLRIEKIDIVAELDLSDWTLELGTRLMNAIRDKRKHKNGKKLITDSRQAF